MTTRPADPVGWPRRLWDLGVVGHARDLFRDLGALVPDGPEALAPGFELSAAVLRQLQADPFLPAEFLPATGPVLRPRRLRPVGRTVSIHSARWNRRG